MGFRDVKYVFVFLLTHSPDPRIKKRIESVKKLDQGNLDIVIIYWNRFKQLFVDNFDVKNIVINFKDSRNLFMRFFKGLLASIVALRSLIEVRPNLIYVDGADFLIPAFFYKWIFNKKTKIVLEIADIPGYYKYKGILKKFLELIINKFVIRVDLIVFTSLFFLENYYKKLLDKNEKVLILENLPEKRIFENFKKNNHELFTIGFIGFLRYVKQLKLLCEACKDIPDVRIFIAGGPASEDFRELLDSCSKIEYFGAYNYERDILNLYSQIDVVYSVYDTDSPNVKIAIPNKLYEAIVCGLPIIVAKGTRLAEYVEKLGVGFSVSDKDPKELRDLILALKSDESIIRKIEERCNSIREKYYWENLETTFLDKINDLIRG